MKLTRRVKPNPNKRHHFINGKKNMNENNLSNPVETGIPPQALDVERSLIGSMLINPGALSDGYAQLKPDCFYSPANEMIFRCLVEMHIASIPIDVVTLANELRKRKQLESVGAEPYLTELVDNVATHSLTNIQHHIEILNEKARLRHTISACSEIQNAAFNPEISMLDISRKVEFLREVVSDTTGIESRVFSPTADNCPDNAKPFIELSGHKILSAGNISILGAMWGSGKSACLEACCASLFNQMGDNLGFSMTARSALYLDTERTRYDFHISWQRYLKRAGLSPDNPPDNVQWINLKLVDNLKDRLSILWSRLDCEHPPEVVFIDGIGDFVLNPNDLEESSTLIYRLTSIADRRGIGILSTLHVNPSGTFDKTRGHLGSEYSRKAEAILNIEKTPGDDIRKVTSDFALGKVRSDSDQISSYFKWDTKEKMHVSCGKPAEAKGKSNCERDKILEYLSSKSTWSYNEMKTGIMDLLGKSDGTAKNKIRDLITLEKIIKNSDDTYSVTKKSDIKTPEYYHN